MRKKLPKNFEINGIQYKTCVICETPKPINEFYIGYKGSRRTDCIYCNLLMKRNHRIIAKNIKKPLQHGLRSWHKHKWKYNIRRKILRIIGVINRSGRRIVD